MTVSLSVPFLCISNSDIQIMIVMIVNADNTCETSVLWMRYSTLERQFRHEVNVCDPFVTQFEVFEMFVLCCWNVWEICFVSLTCLRSLASVCEILEKFVLCFWDVFLRCLRKAEIGVQYQSLQKLDPQKTWQTKKLTMLNSTHTLFDQAQRAPTQIYDKQHGKAKGTISGQAGVRTTQHNMTTKNWNIILKHHDIVGEKKSKNKGGKDWSAKRVGKQQQVTALNLTHNQKRFKHARRKPKQKVWMTTWHGKGNDPKTNQPENH